MDGVALGMLERSRELCEIDRAASQAASGSGSLISVQGPAGQGKSTLLGVAAERLTGAGFQVVTARGFDQERSHAFGVVRQLFARTVGSGRARSRLLVGSAAGAGVLFSPALDTRDVPIAQVLHGLYWLAANLSQAGPLALVVDDVHDADDASLEFLSYLARRIHDLPVIVLAALRPPGQHEPRSTVDAVRDESRSRLDLAPLSVDAVALLVARALATPCDPDFAAACHECTGGNPFYLRELVNEVGRRGLPPTASSEAWVGELRPRVIVRSVLFRLASLPKTALPLARACAVLGDGAALRDAAQLAELSITEAAAAADALVAAGLFAETGELGFAHAILRSAVLEDLGEYQRRLWHARAARHHACAGAAATVIASHLLLSECAADEWAVRTLRAAAKDAVRAGGTSAAVQFLHRALAEPPSEDVRPDVLFELGVAEAAQGHESALAHLHESMCAARDPRVRGERALVFAGYAQKAGPVAQAVEVIDEALAELPDDGSDLLVMLHAERYWDAHINLATAGDVRDGRQRLRRALDRPDGELRRRVAAYLAMDAGLVESRTQALAYAEEAIKEPGLLAFCPPDASAISITLLGLTTIEHHAAFAELADQATLAAGRDGNLLAFALIATLRAMEALSRGRLTDVLAEVEDAAAAVAMPGWQHAAPGLVAMQVRALHDQGRLDEARRVLADSPFDCGDPQDFPMSLLLDARGLVRAATGDVRGGLADFLLCGERMTRLRADSPGMIAWRSHAASAQLQLGQVEEARASAAGELELARRLCGPIRQAEAMRVLARSVGGDAGLCLLREAAELIADAPAALARARVEADLGAILRRRQQLTQAREHLARALDEAASSEAHPLVDYVRAELLAAGGRPRRARGRGVESLTPSELRVARLAADGATNTSIAQTLFLSRKTVEKHLASVYRKLGIERRGQLPAAFSTMADSSR
jgi:DNA-binding CsgD family transcriptional regulator